MSSDRSDYPARLHRRAERAEAKVERIEALCERAQRTYVGALSGSVTVASIRQALDEPEGSATDASCYTTPDGSCIGVGGCMHDPPANQGAPMTYKLAEGAPHPEPMTETECAQGVGRHFRYHVTLTSPISLKSPLAEAFQASVFSEEAGTSGFFEVVDVEPIYVQSRRGPVWYGGLPHGAWRWHIVLERSDCESDYHRCQGAPGHDGSDEQAIAQLQAEIDEAIGAWPQDPRIHNVTVVARHVLDANSVHHELCSGGPLLTKVTPMEAKDAVEIAARAQEAYDLLTDDEDTDHAREQEDFPQREHDAAVAALRAYRDALQGRASPALVSWEIDIPEGSLMTPTEAAQWALETITRNGSIANVFKVHYTDGTIHLVDLEEAHGTE